MRLTAQRSAPSDRSRSTRPTLLSKRPQILGAAALIAAVLTFLVRSQLTDEAQTLLTGVVLIGPFIGALGLMFTGYLDSKGLAGQRAKWPIPDLDQILEVAAVLFAGLITYWLIVNGPSTDPDPDGLNALANDIKNFRREDGTAPVDDVPANLTWFMIGVVLSAPFWFSLGSTTGREIVGRRRKKEQSGAARAPDTGEEPDVFLDEI